MKTFVVVLFLVVVSQGFSQELENLQIEKEKSFRLPYDEDILSPKFHAARREALRELMPKGSAIVFFSNPVRNRSNDINYDYHQDPNFYYLTGYKEPHSMLIIFKDPVKIEGQKVKEIVFARPRDPANEIWDGLRLGKAGVQEFLEIEYVLDNHAFSEFKFPFDQLSGGVFYLPMHDDVRDNNRDPGDLYSLKKHFFSKLERYEGESDNLKPGVWMAKLREVKQDEEIEMLKKAIDITCLAQIELMKNVSPDMKEYQTQALLEYHFKYHGAEHCGFPSIQGSGGNTCILHYTENRKPFKNKDLLLSDIGAEYRGYSADVTRTFPVNGKFTDEQKIIYNLVLEAQEAGIEASRVGAPFFKPHDVATEIIFEGLKELGIVKSRKDLRSYFMHGTSHYLGLDVHDPGMYNPLSPGNVITVEPGIYIAEGSDCDPKWWNIGVRIEDDILITKDGPINLSDCVPKTIETIEQLMNENNQD